MFDFGIVSLPDSLSTCGSVKSTKRVTHKKLKISMKKNTVLF
jgi:hypothetical protein